MLYLCSLGEGTKQHRAGAFGELRRAVHATAREVGGGNQPASAVGLRSSGSGKKAGAAMSLAQAGELAKERGERKRAATGCRCGVGRWPVVVAWLHREMDGGALDRKKKREESLSFLLRFLE